MQRAWIAGEPAALDAAIAEAARLVAASRQALIAGLGTDVAGTRAAIALAERTGAIINHMHSAAVLHGIEVMQSSGVMLTTPTEARVRADTILLVGPVRDDELQEFLRPLSNGAAPQRRAFWLCPGGTAVEATAGINVKSVGNKPRDLPALLAALRARTAGRPIGKTFLSVKALDEIAKALRATRFGVAIWSPSMLDPLIIEMLCGLVNDLNTTTRFSTLPLVPGDNAIGVMHACGWLTGFPIRTGFACGPRHDPWLFDGSRLIASDEIDCAIWISAYRSEGPPWRNGPPTIALMRSSAPFDTPPHVHIAVGCPGFDHDGVQYLSSTGTFTAVAARQPSEAISVADAITRIAAAVPGVGDRRC